MTSAAPDPWRVAAEVGAALEALGLRYAIGGSLASGLVGEPRTTIDIDIVVDLPVHAVDALVARLSPRFHVPVGLLRRAAAERSSASLVDNETLVKVDLFVAGGTPLDASGLERRLAIASSDLGSTLYYHSPEDVLLQKLRWYRKGGEVSDRQWRDVVGIVRVQAGRLDRAYLARGAELLGVTDLLASALAQE